MDQLAELAELEAADSFVFRHIGPSEADITAMLHAVGASSLSNLAGKTLPQAIRSNSMLSLPPAIDEAAVLAEMRALAAQNQPLKSLIGMGYHGTHTPPVILRNVLESPGWYTAYTPYQAEIAQGRLEALLNFQTMICELTGMQIANASLLDEATAAAEAVSMAHAVSKARSNVIAVVTDLHPQTRAVLATRASPLGFTLVDVRPGDLAAIGAANPFALVLQYPGSTGALRDLSEEIDAAHEAGALAIVAADPLALALLTPPGEMGADVVVGSAQRFGVPMGFGGPHAGFFATKDVYKRSMPGRLVGVSVDAAGSAGDAPGATNAGTAHQARKGDQQYLHCAGAAGRDRRVLCRLARTGGAAAHCAAGEPAGAAAGRRGAAIGAAAARRDVLRHDCD